MLGYIDAGCWRTLNYGFYIYVCIKSGGGGELLAGISVGNIYIFWSGVYTLYIYIFKKILTI